MAQVLFHIEQPDPRARYIVHHVLHRVLGWQVRELTDLKGRGRNDPPCLVYGHKPVEGAYLVRPQGSLGGATGKGSRDGLIGGGAPPMPYPTPEGDTYFDPFAAAFWLLTRQEEWTAKEVDEHGRPPSSSFHAARNGYLDVPVVDAWCLNLARQWRQKDGRVPVPVRKYKNVVTLDVDNGFKYKGRSWWRTMGSAARDLLQGRPQEVTERIRVLLGFSRDPYDIYSDLEQMTTGNTDRRIASFLVAPRGVHDHAVGLEYPLMRERIREVSAWAEIGIHPSYRSSDRPGSIEGERHALMQVLGRDVHLSRQHFLRMRWPGTYRELIAAGIREDHSMGMSDAIGFRAGTCTPYPFFDLERNEETELMIHPFVVMDSALCYRMRLNPGDAIRKAKAMVDAVRHVQGTFISVWHERFLSDQGAERGWRRVADEVIRYARS